MLRFSWQWGETIFFCNFFHLPMMRGNYLLSNWGVFCKQIFSFVKLRVFLWRWQETNFFCQSEVFFLREWGATFFFYLMVFFDNDKLLLWNQGIFFENEKEFTSTLSPVCEGECRLGLTEKSRSTILVKNYYTINTNTNTNITNQYYNHLTYLGDVECVCGLRQGLNSSAACSEAENIH